MLIFLTLIYLLAYVLPKIVIDFLQFNYIQKRLQDPAVILNTQDYKKAGNYASCKLKFSIISTLYDTILFLAWIGFGLIFLQKQLLYFDFDNQNYALLNFLLFLLVYTLLNLPLKYYETMILDKKFGFNTQRIGLFAIDFIKGLILTLLFGGFAGYILIYFLNHFDYWWIYGFLFISLLILLINIFYPTVIAPFFNQFTPLKNPTLQSKIIGLLEKVGFQSNGIFVIDASKRDGRLNAYFGGFGKSKRVILFDTLLDKVSDDGLLAILGHELGHFKHKDLLKNLGITLCLIFILFLFAGVFCSKILQGLGSDNNSGSILTLMLLLSPILSFWAMPIIGYYSRNAEYAADNFGAKLTSKTTLANALVRIVNENKAFPYSHHWYVFFHYTHPPLLERLKALEYKI